MALAEVTNNVCANAFIGRIKFPLNRTVIVRDPIIIQRAQVTQGFSVQIIRRAVKKKKAVRAVERTSSGTTKRSNGRSKRAARSR